LKKKQKIQISVNSTTIFELFAMNKMANLQKSQNLKGAFAVIETMSVVPIRALCLEKSKQNQPTMFGDLENQVYGLLQNVSENCHPKNHISSSKNLIQTVTFQEVDTPTEAVRRPVEVFVEAVMEIAGVTLEVVFKVVFEVEVPEEVDRAAEAVAEEVVVVMVDTMPDQ
jgi:hypothetical protein